MNNKEIKGVTRVSLMFSSTLFFSTEAGEVAHSTLRVRSCWQRNMQQKSKQLKLAFKQRINIILTYKIKGYK